MGGKEGRKDAGRKGRRERMSKEMRMVGLKMPPTVYLPHFILSDLNHILCLSLLLNTWTNKYMYLWVPSSI